MTHKFLSYHCAKLEESRPAKRKNKALATCLFYQHARSMKNAPGPIKAIGSLAWKLFLAFAFCCAIVVITAYLFRGDLPEVEKPDPAVVEREVAKREAKLLPDSPSMHRIDGLDIEYTDQGTPDQRPAWWPPR